MEIPGPKRIFEQKCHDGHVAFQAFEREGSGLGEPKNTLKQPGCLRFIEDEFLPSDMAITRIPSLRDLK